MEGNNSKFTAPIGLEITDTILLEIDARLAAARAAEGRREVALDFPMDLHGDRRIASPHSH
jgi:hypothetical protein